MTFSCFSFFVLGAAQTNAFCLLLATRRKNPTKGQVASAMSHLIKRSQSCLIPGSSFPLKHLLTKLGQTRTFSSDVCSWDVCSWSGWLSDWRSKPADCCRSRCDTSRWLQLIPTVTSRISYKLRLLSAPPSGSRLAGVGSALNSAPSSGRLLCHDSKKGVCLLLGFDLCDPAAQRANHTSLVSGPSTRI